MVQIHDVCSGSRGGTAAKLRFTNGERPNNRRFAELLNMPDCAKWLVANGYPIPVRSSCVFCPYSSNITWKNHKKDKDVWNKIINIDEAIRTKEELQEELQEEFYLHRSCKPINEVYLQEDQTSLFENECEGYCGL